MKTEYRHLPSLRQGILCLCVFLLAASGIQASTETLEPKTISMPRVSRNQSPALVFSKDGTLRLAWSSFQNGVFRLAVTEKNNTGWNAIVYPDPTPSDQLEPQWGKEGENGLFLVYSTFENGEWFIKKISLKNNSWSPSEKIGKGIRPSAYGSIGRQWITWEDGGRIYIRTCNDLWEETCELNPASNEVHYSHPVLAGGRKGEVWLTWTASQPGYQSVKLKRLDLAEAEILTVDEGQGVNRNPALSVGRDGKAWIVYEALENPDTKAIPEGEFEANDEGVRYVMDRKFSVRNPSQVVVVTDGRNWWKPVSPGDPASGLLPNIFCAAEGAVYLVSRSFQGLARPYREFYPMLEILGPTGWTNSGVLEPEQKGYKERLDFAESPSGEIWTAWFTNERKKISSTQSPSWSHLDGDDFIHISRLSNAAITGGPVLEPFSHITKLLPPSVVLPRYQTEYNGEHLNVYFGDPHQHSEFSGCGRLNGRIDQNQHYSRYVRGLDFMSTIDHGEHLNDHNWRMTQLVSERHNTQGKFVTFTGFEWTSEFDRGGNLYRGHYNAIFRDVGSGDTYFSASLPQTNTPLELWNALKNAVGGPERVLTFAHHTSRRMAWISWNYYDPEMAPLIEIAQARGSYEYEGCFSQQEHLNDCSRVSGHYIHDGLARGMRWGFVAAGDHGGRQLTAVFSTSLDRGELFDSLKKRMVYATNGERMFLDIRVDGHFMGEEYTDSNEVREGLIQVKGTTPLIEVVLVRNGRVLRQWHPQTKDFEISWEDKEPPLQRENSYYLRAVQQDGGQAWSSPIWVICPEHKGKFHFQVGGDELHVLYEEQEADISILMHNETEKTVSGRVRLNLPVSWDVKEKNGLDITCPPGGWRQAVFHVRVPGGVFQRLCLPDVSADFEGLDGGTLGSDLFIVGSPFPLSRERKAVLMDARSSLASDQFAIYFKKTAEIWEKNP